MTGMLTLVETDDFFFDAQAAERPVKFIERYCQHYEGRHAGKPFELHPVQRKIVTDLFGWKYRRGEREGCRRFTDVYFEAAVGAGKSPLLSALGLYGLMLDGEAAAQVYSLASTYQQARVVFDTAKKFCRFNRQLAAQVSIVEREIRHRATASTWQIVSGKGPGAGCKPSLILGDEAHQWGGAGAYQDLRDRMFKRLNPLLVIATNAGESRDSFCWTLREKAVAALAGTGDVGLYPIIFAADEDADTDDPAAWRAANPLLGVTMNESQVAANIAEAMKDEHDEVNARRLYLGIWPRSGAGAWLDMESWDACTADTAEAAAPPRDAPLYIGLDLSQSDDLSAVGLVSPTPERMHLDAHFWLPRVTADRYRLKDGIPYDEWERAGYITLLDEPTISSTVRRQIAERIIRISKRRQVVGVYYDQYRADETVAVLESAGIACMPVSQGYKTSPGCFELDRRLKERAAVISPNRVLRFCATNAEVEHNTYGEVRVVKPNAKGRYAGTRCRKVDGVTAIAQTLTEARKHAFPAAKRYWKGQVHA